MDHSPGTVVADRYRLVQILGRGGMGVVWRATDERLRRDVALKQLVLPPGLSEQTREQLVARVEREALAAAKLKHPGIVTVHDRVTDAEGIPWIVMELVEGRSLSDVVAAEGPLPPERAAGIGRAVLGALATAHAHGVVHRDIKPANILLEDDRVVLTDFGIAAVEGEGNLTQTGSVLGTPNYMAPEQVSALPATGASDLWSLGATLYFAVEGRPPFSAASASAVFLAIAGAEPSPAVNAGPLEPALTALLRKDPAQRPTALEAAALLDFSQAPPGEPGLSAVPPPAPGPDTAPTRVQPPAPPEPPAKTLAADPARPGHASHGLGRHGRTAAICAAVVCIFALAAFLRDGLDKDSGSAGASGSPSSSASGGGAAAQPSAPAEAEPGGTEPVPGATLAAVPRTFVDTWEIDAPEGERVRVDIDEGGVGAEVAELRFENGEAECEATARLVWATADKIVLRTTAPCAPDPRLTLTLRGADGAVLEAGVTETALEREP